jgi:hypothetical protein
MIVAPFWLLLRSDLGPCGFIFYHGHQRNQPALPMLCAPEIIG